MITEFSIRDYRCLKDVSVKLTPLHAFIGPNDSGKSTLLRAMEELSGGIGGLSSGVGFRLSTASGYRFDGPFVQPGGLIKIPSNMEYRLNPNFGWWNGSQRLDPQTFKDIQKQFAGTRLLRLDPDDLRAPTQLIRQGVALTMSERGRNLPAVYDAILNRGDDTFRAIADGFRKLFPTVKHLRMRAVSESEKTFEIDLVDGARVGADGFSEGMLYYLAFAALPYLAPVSLLLVEEPENGLHPSRIAEVMRILRAIADGGTQVILATHSPLVVNEMTGDEVSVVTRPPDKGTQVKLLKDTPRFAERSKVYALGELWLSYADGNYEAALLSGTEAS